MDGGQTWKNAKVRLDDMGNPLPGHPSGNWVVALERLVLPDGSTSIWAGTNTTPLPGQTQAISISRDLGQTWAHTGPTFAWDFAFTPNFAWAGTGQGLLASRDPALTLDANRDWSAIEIDGHNFKEIEDALLLNTNKPKVIIANTIKGKGVSYMENQFIWHYKSPNKEELIQAYKELE